MYSPNKNKMKSHTLKLQLMHTNNNFTHTCHIRPRAVNPSSSLEWSRLYVVLQNILKVVTHVPLCMTLVTFKLAPQPPSEFPIWETSHICDTDALMWVKTREGWSPCCSPLFSTWWRTACPGQRPAQRWPGPEPASWAPRRSRPHRI